MQRKFTGKIMSTHFSAIGGIRPAPRFDFEIVDDVIGRTISHGYDVLSLPIAG